MSSAVDSPDVESPKHRSMIHGEYAVHQSSRVSRFSCEGSAGRSDSRVCSVCDPSLAD